MYPCSVRMRAISVLSLDAGMSTVVCDAGMPLRIRVRESAMGSVIDMLLPAALRHAGDVAVVRELPQADEAHAQLAEHRTRAPAVAAAGVLARLELRTACLAHALGRLGHVRPPLNLKGLRCPHRDRGRRGRTACRTPAAARTPRRPSWPRS